jgi:hypothetical protein
MHDMAYQPTGEVEAGAAVPEDAEEAEGHKQG